MKARAFLLCACMLVLPMLAMFSHKIPATARQAMRDGLWRPAHAAVTQWLDGGTPDAPPPVLATAAIPAPAAEPPTPAPKASAADAAQSPAEVMPTVAIGSSPLSPPEGDPAKRLSQLGAVNVQVKVSDTDGRLHVASCRVAVDARGQLQRLFQSTGITPEESMQRLCEQVSNWKTRMASAFTAPENPGAKSAAATGPPAPSPPRLR